ncbi:methionine--tRNA ligase [Candidatus Nomurabacteria bacterium]|nr:methionine--tRNA ligase [Candidatus Nomurabacteria bacterium]USN95136.1 MAG: methionine--tRNA ligase [Candidatus Nomurabacteria bacterium]
MFMKKPFYITTTLPYVNAELHMGHALEFVRADVIARYKKLTGFDVFFNSGTDEHGSKIWKKAKEEGKDVQDFVNENVEKFYESVKLFGVSDDINFIRTSDPHHTKAAQEFWKRVNSNGFIYKKNYQTKYCSGCESEKTDSELSDGKCTEHPNLEIEFIDEENYFFKYSEFSSKLLDFYKQNPDFIIPEFRFNEVKAFVERGLQDFSISRLKEKMPWGIEVPGDENHVMYVWFDALTNYIANVGFPDDTEKFEKYWVNGTPTQYCGKDNTRFQGAMWQAMLMAADLPNSKRIVVNGHITGDGGVKMSKSLGNTVDPKKIAEEYSTDALRYFLIKEVSSFEDSPFTIERFKDAYNAGLANGLGNLASRILTLSEKYLETCPEITENNLPQEFFDHLEKYEIQKASDFVWKKIQELDERIQKDEPFKVVKVDLDKGKQIISEIVVDLYVVSEMLEPLLPETSKYLKEQIKLNQKPEKPLFLRV